MSVVAREYVMGELFDNKDNFAEHWADECAGSFAGLCDFARAGASESYGPLGSFLGGSGGA